MPRSSVPERPLDATARGLRALKNVMPTGGGLSDEDWNGRHRLLTWTMIGSETLLTITGVVVDRLDLVWLISVLVVALCSAAALQLPPRRLPSSAVALGLTTVCAGLVMMFSGLTEAHFSFFVAVGLLALYRDWVPFGIFLLATVAHHALMGMLMADRTYDHMSAIEHPWRWAVVHGVAVLLMAATQVIAWRLTEAEEARANDDLTRAEAQFTAAFEEAPVPMCMLSPYGVVLRLNPAFLNWLDLEPLPIGATLGDLPISSDLAPTVLARLREGSVDVLNEHQVFRHVGGRLIHVDLHASALRDDAGELKVVVCHFLDTTEKHAQEEVLQRRAREDSLTGLLSRGAFERDLVALIESRPGHLSVIYIDVDRFKVINDSYGHGAGDEVLRVLGTRLTALAPLDALVARLGGDEFAIALTGPIERAHKLGEAIVNSCAAPLPVVGGHLSVTVSIGVSAAMEGEDAEAAIQSADLAMYAAKQTGRARVRLFDEGMREATESRVAAEHLLREALDADWSMSLPVWFQPIVSLDSPGRPVVGAEALIRLRTPEGGLVPPGVFIPIAEETGLVVPLGEHVLTTALAHLCAWESRLSYVSVNVSPRQLSEGGFVSMLSRVLTDSGLQDRSRLVLEITETSMLTTGVDLESTLEAIKALGVRLALDDFGTGYSSLTWLQSVPADIVKLDRSFVAGLATDSAKASIISAVLWLARSLGMSVVAEGVEDVSDADRLAEAGCPNAQGYLFGRPMEAHDLEAVLPPTRAPYDSGPFELSSTRPRIASVS